MKLIDKNDNLTVIDAEYRVVPHAEDKWHPIHVNKETRSIVKSVVSAIWSVVLFTFKMFASLFVEGVSGTVEGIKEASEMETKRYESSVKSKQRQATKKPIWYIPTKEEEDMERYRQHYRG